MSTKAPNAPAQPGAKQPHPTTRPTVPTQAGPRPAPRPGPAAGRTVIPQQLRRPKPGDRVPRMRQIMGICGWAAVLGGVGLVIGVRGFLGILAGDAAAWYEPALALAGAVGILLTVTSFLTAHLRKVPWALLTSASVVLVVAMGLTVAAF
jgi:hypothetical protein